MLPLSLALFPSPEFDHLSIGPYGHAVAPSALVIPELRLYELSGLEVGYGRLRWEEPPDFEDLPTFLQDEFFESTLEMDYAFLARAYVGRDGTLQVDQLRADLGFSSLRIRRELGDYVDLAVLAGHGESTWGTTDVGAFHLRGFRPYNLTLLGFSDTDQDENSRLRRYVSIGSGVGGEAIGRLAGAVGVYARGMGKATTLNRRKPDAPNYVRHEVHAEAELGLGAIGRRQAVWLGAWGELTTQWETRDDDGKSGLDRQYAAWGVRLNGRLYQERDEADEGTEL